MSVTLPDVPVVITVPDAVEPDTKTVVPDWPPKGEPVGKVLPEANGDPVVMKVETPEPDGVPLVVPATTGELTPEERALPAPPPPPPASEPR
jgi:hypothetical protein